MSRTKLVWIMPWRENGGCKSNPYELKIIIPTILFAGAKLLIIHLRWCKFRGKLYLFKHSRL